MDHLRHSTRIRRGAAAALAVLLCAGLPAASWGGIYRWTDAHGGVHYTQTPPPDGPYTALQGPPAPPEAAASPAPAAPGPTAAPMPDRQPAAASAPAAPKLTGEQQEAACKAARQRLTLLQQPRIRMKYPDGTYKRLTEDERQQDITATQKRVADLCPGQ